MIRLVRAFRIEEGWLVLGVGLGLILSLPLLMVEISWVPGLGATVPIALAAYLVGILLAKSPFPGWLATIASGMIGAEFVVNRVGQILPPLLPVVREFGRGTRWLWQLWRTQSLPPYYPFEQLALQTWDRGSRLYAHVWWWGHAALTGEPFSDPQGTVFLLLMGLSIWAVTTYAAWGLYRRRQVLAFLLPVGLGLTVNVFYSRQGYWYLLAFLAGVIFLSAWEHLFTLERRWQRAHIDYAEAIRTDVALAGILISALVLALAYVFPYVTTYKFAFLFWRYAEAPWQVMADTADRLFNEVESPGRPAEEVPQVLAGPIVGGVPLGSVSGLPRLHLLRQGEELGTRVVMYVTTDDPPPVPEEEQEHNLTGTTILQGPKHYWRSTSYDVYTGRGWENSSEEIRDLLPNEAVADPEEWTGRERLEQTFELLTPHELALYASNRPFHFDQASRSMWRDSEDLIGLEATSPEMTYGAVSLVPEVTSDDLEGAGTDYPDWVSERYLQLPDTLPARVMGLAREVAADAESPYEQALLIEDYLRNYEYTLDIPSPPSNQDVVDYFLFDLQKGYCDYYASAMVVMARSLGLPARLAVGYAMGAYDPFIGKYVVVENDAHSWAEVFFPGYGWIEFEPTAGRSVFYRPGAPERLPSLGDTQRLPPKPLPGEETASELQLDWRSVAIAAGLILWLAFLGVSLWRRWRRSRMTAADYVGRFWERLLGHGTRLNVIIQANQTPAEYAQAFNGRIQDRALDTAHWTERVQREIQLARQEVNTIAEAYIRARYSAHPLSEEEKGRLTRTWRQLRRRLLFLWLAPAVP